MAKGTNGVFWKRAVIVTAIGLTGGAVKTGWDNITCAGTDLKVNAAQHQALQAKDAELEKRIDELSRNTREDLKEIKELLRVLAGRQAMVR